MSNALSIATVTAVIKNLLENGLVGDAIAASVGDVLVTALPPDRIQVGSDERAQINLFLYQVTQNRNVDWVSQEFRSRYKSTNDNMRAKNTPLALDLHYLLTAYGAKDFQAEILLGYAMQMLHISPIITSNVVNNTLINASQTTSSVFSQALAGISVSNLVEQIGQIKISSEFLNMEETSKIWSALQTHYRPSVTYQASMVLIESDSNDALYFDSILSEPIIEQVTAPFSESQQKIVVGNTLILRGKRLQGDVTKVRLSKADQFYVPFDIQPGQVSLLVPPDLRAGVQSVQVVHQKIGIIRETDNLVESNVAAFVLHPKITVQTLHLTSLQGNNSNLRSGEITIKLTPKVSKEQRGVLYLNENKNENKDENKDENLKAYSFLVPARQIDTDTLVIPFKDVSCGTYLVRVSIDGAESLLYKNKAGEYDSSQVNIS